MATNIFVYWSDGLGSRAFDRHSRKRGGAFANENCPHGRALDHFFKCLGFARRFARGMLAAGIDSHITRITVIINTDMPNKQNFQVP